MTELAHGPHHLHRLRTLARALENNVLVELTEGEVDLEKVNTDNATSTYVIDYLIAKLKLMNINVL